MKEVVLGNGLRVLIRPQKLEDADRLWRLYSSLSSTTRALSGIPERLDEQGFRERMTNLARHQHRYVCAVRSPKERFIGYFGVDTPEDPRTGWIFLFVHDDYQGQGLGREILAYMIEEAPLLGLKTLKCQVYVENKPAISLLQRYGFQKEKEWSDLESGKSSYTMSRAVTTSLCSTPQRRGL